MILSVGSCVVACSERYNHRAGVLIYVRLGYKDRRRYGPGD
jgi:hypothetical protein